MWKKDDTSDEPTPPRRDAQESAASRERTRKPVEQATIGRSIRIRGEVSGDEDLLIQGHVDGTVNLKQHALTVGSEGEVKADVTARLITVEGRVEGDLTAEEQLILRGSAEVDGDLTAPRVVLEDGARFRGGIDMGDPTERDRGRPKAAASPSPGQASGSGQASDSGKTEPSKAGASSETSSSKGSAKGGGSTSGSSADKGRARAGKGGD